MSRSREREPAGAGVGAGGASGAAAGRATAERPDTPAGAPGAPPSATAGGGAEEARFRVEGMDCADCVRRVEDRLHGLEGVREATGNAMSRRLRVSYDAARLDESRIRSELGKIGFLAREEREASGLERAEVWTGTEALRAYASGALLGLGLLLRLAGLSPPWVLVPWDALGPAELLFLGSALVGGWNFIPAGVRSLRTLSLNMNFLMTVAILGAVGIGEYAEAGAIAFLFSLAELLEAYAVDRARGSVRALLEVSPERATVVRDGEEVVVSAAELSPGDVVLVRGGDKLPADGTVLEGSAAVDESPITGESVPADKVAGDEVFAGSISTGGFLRVRVERSAGETTLASIVRLIEEAEERKAPSERFIERFARWYTPAVTVGAVLVVAVPTLLLGEPFGTWFVRGLTLLVIACPCALVISTPVAVVSGITAAARNGVLIKGGQYLEDMARVRVVAFDKTGTLTYGHPEVTDVRWLAGAGSGGGPRADRERELLALAAALEARSEHPVARAIVRAARERGVEPRPGRVTGFEAVPGRGVRASLEGEAWAVGSPGLFDRDGDDAALRDALGTLRGDGKTVVLVGRPDAPLGLIGLADRERSDAVAAVRTLRGAGIHTVMLTGDAPEMAGAVARALGVDEVYAGLLPEEKVERLRALEARHGPVAMVGDGINDGPALAAARVGIAMGAAGSDIALETADVALMGDDLSRLAYLYRLSRRGRGVMTQNVAAALVAKLTLAIGVPFGVVSLVAAVLIGDLGASLAVTTNALRLARVRPE